MKNLVLFISLAVVIEGVAQKTKDHWVTFNYERLPLKPLDSRVKNYQSLLISWENEGALQQQQLYDQQLEAYRQDYKIAQEHYQRELEEYNRKSRLERIIDKELLEQGRPVFNPPPYPEFKELPKMPDTEALTSKYLSLDGYTKGFEVPVFITVQLREFEMGTTEAKTTTSGEKTTTTYFTKYKQPVKLTVESSIDGVLYDYVLDASMQFYTYKSNSEPTYNEVKTFAVNDLLAYTSDFINSNFGKTKMQLRTSVVLVLKHKRFIYPEFEQALPHALAGYNNLYLDRNKAVSGFNQAINIWEKLLEEYNPGNKKARVNRDVAWYTMLNIAEAYLWIDNYAKADEYFNRMEATQPSWVRKRLTESRQRLKDHQERFLANQR